MILASKTYWRLFILITDWYWFIQLYHIQAISSRRPWDNILSPCHHKLLWWFPRLSSQHSMQITIIIVIENVECLTICSFPAETWRGTTWRWSTRRTSSTSPTSGFCESLSSFRASHLPRPSFCHNTAQPFLLAVGLSVLIHISVNVENI